MLGMPNPDKMYRGHDGLAARCHGDHLVIYMKQATDNLEDNVIGYRTLLSRQRSGSVVSLFFFLPLLWLRCHEETTQGVFKYNYVYSLLLSGERQAQHVYRIGAIM